MAAAYKTPGVYIVEQNAFPPSIVAVATAVPAFIGFTAKSDFKGRPLKNKPFKVTSMSEFIAAFGGPPVAQFTINRVTASAAAASVETVAPPPTPDQIKAVTALANKDDGLLTAITAGKLSDAQVTTLQTAANAGKDAAKKATDLAAIAAFPLAGPSADQIATVKQLLADLGTAVDAKTLTDEQRAQLHAAADAETDPAKKKAAEAALDAFPPPAPAAATVPGADDLAKLKAAIADTTTKLTAAIGGDKPLDAASLSTLSAFGAGLGDQPAVAAALNAVVTHLTPTPPATTQPVAVSPPDPAAIFTSGDTAYYLSLGQPRYLLYYSMLLFFQNGGGPCWIVSVGKHGDPIVPGVLTAGLDALKDEEEPTLVVIPDAVSLDDKDKCTHVQQQMLMHCGSVMKNRFAILDLYNGAQGVQDDGAPVDNFRNDLGIDNLSYGAAYYPWLNTTIVDDTDIAYSSFIDSSATPTAMLLEIVKPTDPAALDAWNKAKLSAGAAKAPTSLENYITGTPSGADPATDSNVALVDKSLTAISPLYKAMVKVAARQLNLLPPAAAMAGIYTAVDNARGVWKAPANVSINSVVSPAVPISQYAQEGLNVDPMGKSINAIRSFIGEGVLVWGARTLDGNSLDWRYINVRRTMIFLEESCRLAAKQMVFEPNVAGTWVTIRSMISNFLNTVWRQGGLAGAVPEDAFSVHCGLGATMTADDILEGYMRVTVLVAISRPAEFVEITFQQEMQKS